MRAKTLRKFKAARSVRYLGGALVSTALALILTTLFFPWNLLIACPLSRLWIYSTRLWIRFARVIVTRSVGVHGAVFSRVTGKTEISEKADV
jgi:hypothetical protein